MTTPIRTIEFQVTPAGITPSAPQFAGVQGEHNATRVVFRLDEALLQKAYTYRVELTDSAGVFDTTGTLAPVGNTVCCELPGGWTRHGGIAEVRLCIALLDEQGEEQQVVYSFAGRLRFAPRVEGEPISAAEAGGLSGLVAQAEQALATASAAAQEVQDKLDSGAFVGEKGEKGDRGEPGVGVAASLAPGLFGVHVNANGHLILTYHEDETPPPLSIKDGRLIYTLGSPVYEKVTGGYYALTATTTLPAGKSFYSPNGWHTGGVSYTQADYERSDNKYYPLAFRQAVSLKQGQALYVVFEPFGASGQAVYDAMMEWYMHVSNSAGAEVAVFQRHFADAGAGISTIQRQHGLTLAYGCTAKEDWTAETADAHLLDNYTELTFYTGGSTYEPMGMTDVWAPPPTSPISNLRLGIVNGWGGILLDSGYSTIGRVMLKFIAPADDTYTVHAFGAGGLPIYLLKD